MTIEKEEKKILEDIKQAKKEVSEGKYISIKSDSLEERFAGI